MGDGSRFWTSPADWADRPRTKWLMGDRSGLSHRGVSRSTVRFAGHHAPLPAGTSNLGALSSARNTAVGTPDDARDRLGGWWIAAHSLLAADGWKRSGW